MTRQLRLPRLARVLCVLGACLVALGGLPPAPVSAKVFKTVPLDDTIADFSRGRTLLTSIVPTDAANEPPGGTLPSPAGGIALAPIKALKWRPDVVSDFGTDRPRTAVGAAAIGNTIWVVGGSSGTPTVYHSSVFRGTVQNDPTQLGAGTVTWDFSFQMPTANHWRDDVALSGAVRSATAVASLVPDPVGAPNSGYLYVVGGLYPAPSLTSSRSILIGKVTNGSLTWLPEPAGGSRFLPALYRDGTKIAGVDSATALVHTTVSGRTFLYVIGGRNTPPPAGTSDGNWTARPVAYVVWTEIDRSTGELSGTWQKSAPVPGLGSSAGVYNSSAVVDSFVDSDGVAQDVMFVIAGNTAIGGTNNDPKALVWKGAIDPDTGAVTWSDADAPGSPGSLGDARNGHGALTFEDSIYVGGGRNTTTFDRKSYTSQVEADLTLTRDPQTNNNFAQDPNGLPTRANPGRSQGGVVLVPTTQSNLAYAYLMGGTNGTEARYEVYRAEVGQLADVPPEYPLEGWFVSAPASFLDIAQSPEASVRAFKWYTNMAQGSGDLEIQYRMSGYDQQASCESLGRSNTVPWRSVDGVGDDGVAPFSNNNTAGLPYAENNDITVTDLAYYNCFQYRVRIARNPSNADQTPILLRLSMQVEVPGSPDLLFPNDAVTKVSVPGGSFGIEVRYRNENVFDLPTQSAVWCYEVNCTPGGSFSIEAFIFPPGATVIQPTQPLLQDASGALANSQLAPYHRAFIDIQRSQVGPNQTLTLGRETKWCDPASNLTCSEQRAQQRDFVLGSRFDQGPGTYRVVLVIDASMASEALREGLTLPAGSVWEQSLTADRDAAEKNNVSAVFDVVISEGQQPPPDGQSFLYLPVVAR